MEILSDKELMRYNRQIVIPAFDIDGQEALKQARVLVIGVGGLGCGAAQYLAAAGVGHLTLVDFDEVEGHNLQRQILHTDARVGMNKAESAKAAIAELNHYVEVAVITERLEDEALTAQVADHTLVLDCTDNLDTRNQLNRVCYGAKVPLVSGAAIRMEGLVTVLNYAEDQPCYHCFSAMFGDQQLSCVESGILSPVVGLISSIQATEAIKQISGMGKPLHGRMLMVDAMTMQFREMKVPKMPGCSVCG